MILALSVMAAMLASSVVASEIGFSFTAKTAAFQIQIDGVTWLQGSGAFVRDSGKTYSTTDGSLVYVSDDTYNGVDDYGDFAGQAVSWTMGANGKRFVTTARYYQEENMVAFEQSYPDGTSSSASGNSNNVISGFPIYTLTDVADVGYLAFAGDMSSSQPEYGKWTSSAKLPGGISGTGPIVVFDNKANSSVVLAPGSNFMAASHAQDSSNLQCGIMGNVDEVPADYSIEFHVTSPRFGTGVNDAVYDWGFRLQRRYNKPFDAPSYDPMTRFLQYSTDNGAVYYYNTEKNKTYEDTILDVKAYSVAQNIPYRTLLLDSYWYPKGPDDGVLVWLPMGGNYFPHGFAYLRNQTQWLFMAHNRYWSSKNYYAKQNGGEYDFLIQGSKALPLTQEFWDFLMSSSAYGWGMEVYEQDWLDVEFDGVSALESNATLARTWLMQFGKAAERVGKHVQYCMSHVRHMLQSVEIPAVTTARASGDYHASKTTQWPIGVSGLLASSLGVAPSKDNAWSVAVQPENPYNDGRTEPRGRLQAAVLTLSRGPVAFSDGVGQSDAKLINRACMADGTLLRPDRSATAIEEYFINKAFGSGGVTGEVWSTETRIARREFRHLLSATVQTAFHVTPNMINLDANVSYVAWEANLTAGIIPFSASHPIVVQPNTEQTFTLHHFSPVEFNGWALIGETDKWMPTSRDRFTNIVATPTSLTAHFVGPEGETVNVAFAAPNSTTPVIVSCTIPQSGSASASVPSKTCTNND